MENAEARTRLGILASNHRRLGSPVGRSFDRCSAGATIRRLGYMACTLEPTADRCARYPCRSWWFIEPPRRHRQGPNKCIATYGASLSEKPLCTSCADDGSVHDHRDTAGGVSKQPQHLEYRLYDITIIVKRAPTAQREPGNQLTRATRQGVPAYPLVARRGVDGYDLTAVEASRNAAGGTA